MTFKKLHKRQLLPPVGTTTTPAAPPPTTTSSTTVRHNTMQPPGRPTDTPTSTSVSTSSSVSSTSSSSSSSSASLTTSVSSVSTATPVSTSTRTTPTPNSITRSTVRVTATTSPSATPTANADSGGMSIGAMAGIAGAALVGIGVITAFIVWFMRRRNRNRDIDEEPFNRNSFLRHSTALPDDDDAPLPSRIRPPPSMSERQPTPVYGGAQTFSDMPQNAFGYNTQPSYSAQPGQTFNHLYGPGGAPATPLPFSPGFGTAYDQQGFNNGGYTDLTRGAPNHEYPPSPRGHDQYDNPHSGPYDNFPMPPAAAAGSAPPGESVHYPELTPATTSAQQGQVISVRDSIYNGRETPVQLGFTPASGPPAHPHQGRAPHGARPETMYDTNDAYGGI